MIEQSGARSPANSGDERIALGLPFLVGLALGLGEIIRDCSLTCDVGFELAPVAFLSIALLSAPLGGLRTRLSQRLGHLRWQTGTLLFLAVSLVAFRGVTWVLLEGGFDARTQEQGLRVTYLVFFVWLGAALAVLAPDLKETFSLLAPRPRRRRLLAWSAALFVAGGLAGSALALGVGPLLLDWLGRYEHARDSLMLAMAGGMALAAGGSAWLARRQGTSTAQGSQESTAEASIVDVLRWLRAVPRYRQAALLILSSAAAETVVFFVFYWVVSEQVPGDDGRSIYFARLYLVLNGATLAMLAFGSNRAIDRIGLALTLALLPAVVLAGLSLWWLVGTVMVMYGLRVAQTAVGDALYDRAVDRMLQLLDGPQAPLVRPVLDGVVHRAGQGIASVLLLFGTFALGAPVEAFVALGLAAAAVWSIAIVRARSLLAEEAAYPSS